MEGFEGRKKRGNLMQFYDYIEVQPINAIKHLLDIESSGFKTIEDLENHLKICSMQKKKNGLSLRFLCKNELKR